MLVRFRTRLTVLAATLTAATILLGAFAGTASALPLPPAPRVFLRADLQITWLTVGSTTGSGAWTLDARIGGKFVACAIVANKGNATSPITSVRFTTNGPLFTDYVTTGGVPALAPGATATTCGLPPAGVAYTIEQAPGLGGVSYLLPAVRLTDWYATDPAHATYPAKWRIYGLVNPYGEVAETSTSNNGAYSAEFWVR